MRPRIITPGGRPRVKVALGYPYGSGVTGPFLESLLGLQLYELSKPQPLFCYRLPQSGLYIDHNRNRIVEKFMKTDADWLLQIDSDIEFPKTIIETLLELAGSRIKILAASVPLGPPFPSCAWMMTDSPGIWRAVPSEKITAEPLEVDGLATAILLVHRDVLEAIAAQVGQCWFLKMMTPKLAVATSAEGWAPGGRVKDREYVAVGEDLAFCMRARDAGFSSWCVKVPGLKHHKTLPMSHDYEEPEPELAAMAIAGSGK